MTTTETLARWLAEHEFRLERFASPLSEADVAAECGLSAADVRRAVREADPPVHHVWPDNRLYCLRPAGPEHVGLDREASLIGAVERDFAARGFQTAREMGSPEHVAALVERPDLSALEPGRDLCDLWALRTDGSDVELWIVEAKGKQAAEFAHFNTAEALAQLMPVRGELLTAMFGAEQKDTPGRGIAAARTLLDGWRARGLEPTVHIAVLLPEQSPDVVWKGGRATPVAEGLYVEPLRALREFLVSGDPPYRDDGSRARAAFGDLLEELDGGVGLRELAAARSGLCFRVLTVAADRKTGGFEVAGREPMKRSLIRRTADRIRRKLEGLTAGSGAADEPAEPSAATDPARELADCRADLAAVAERVAAVEGRAGEIDALAARCAALEERLDGLEGLTAELSRVRSLATVALVVAGLVAVAVVIVLWTAL